MAGLCVVCLAAGLAIVSVSMLLEARRTALEAVGGGFFATGLILAGTASPLFH